MPQLDRLRGIGQNPCCLRYFQLLERRAQGIADGSRNIILPQSRSATDAAWRGLLAAVVALAVGWGGMVYAANNSVQGAKKEEGGFDGDAPTAILIEASSGSVLFEKNADELRAPSSMMKLMTAEVVFNAIKKGEVKLTDEYRVSENAWRKGGAPSGGSTMFAAIHSKVSGRRSAARRHHPERQRRLHRRWPRAWPATSAPSPPR